MKTIKSIFHFFNRAHNSATTAVEIANERLEGFNQYSKDFNKKMTDANALATHKLYFKKNILPISALIRGLSRYAEVCTVSYRLNFQNQPISSETKTKLSNLNKGNVFIDSGKGMSLSSFLKLAPERRSFSSDQAFKEVETIYCEVLQDFYKSAAEIKNKSIKDNVTRFFFVRNLVESKVDDDILLLFLSPKEIESYR